MSIVVLPGSPVQGVLQYIADDYSFLFREAPGRPRYQGEAVVSVDTLQIAVDVASGRALFVDGLRPYTRWREASLTVPDLSESTVAFTPVGDVFESGVGYSYLDSAQWVTHFDAGSGWVCVGDPRISTAHLIATHTALGIEEGRLKSIWLRPEMR